MYTDDQQRNYLSLWHSGYGKIKTYINNGKKKSILAFLVTPWNKSEQK